MEHTPCTTLDAIGVALESFEGQPDDFVLAISDTLQDPVGIVVAVITDKALAKGWCPASFEQRVGYRLYHFKLFSECLGDIL